MFFLVKYVDGKKLRILVEPSYTIYEVKLNIEYAYGRDRYLLEEQKVRYGEFLLEDDLTLATTEVLEN